MAIKKVISRKTGKKLKKDSEGKASLGQKTRSAVGKSAKKTIAEKATVKKAAAPKKTIKRTATKKVSSVEKVKETSLSFDSERIAERVELVDNKESSVSVETLKIGLLLAAIDGNCDKNEIKKFKTFAKSCGGLSDAKISQIITQMQRRISDLENAIKKGATDEELIRKFVEEARKIGISAKCRNFVLWMSIAMVDGEYSRLEQKAIEALRQYGDRSFSFQFRSARRDDISDIFLKRCQMLLSGIYMADMTGDKRMMNNRMKSLQTLIEIAEA